MSIKDHQHLLDHFGERVVRGVYDESLAYLLRTVTQPLRGVKANELFRAFQSLDATAAETARRLMLEAVDYTFARFLQFFDEQGLRIVLSSDTGEDVDLCAVSDGLAGEPYTDEGWIARYSRFQRGLQL